MNSRELARNIVAVLLALFILFTIYYFYSALEREMAGSNAQENYSLSEPQGNLAEKCASGSTQNCTTILNCSGSRACVDERWSECILRNACMPGKKRDCHITPCLLGKEACNSCGTAYENCS